MSILLSGEQLNDIMQMGGTPIDYSDVIAKNAAIQAVQYLEGKCIEHYSVFKSPSKQMYGHDGQFFMLRRIDCYECLKQIHEELGI